MSEQPMPRNVPFAGVIWYQGENNAIEQGDPQCYQVLLEGMIADWRDAMDAPELPFYIVQLPNFRHAPTWDYARVRDAQRRVAQADPHTGVAITMDLGEADDIHPRNKHDVGRRLALLALPEIYGRPSGVMSGPLPVSAKTSGRGIVIDCDLLEALHVFSPGRGPESRIRRLGDRATDGIGPHRSAVLARRDGERIRRFIPRIFARLDVDSDPPG